MGDREWFAWSLVLLLVASLVVVAVMLPTRPEARALCTDLYATAETRTDSLEGYVAHEYCGWEEGG